MPGSPKRIRPDCPYSASQLNLIKLQDDRVALDLGILSEDEIGMPESPKRTCVDFRFIAFSSPKRYGVYPSAKRICQLNMRGYVLSNNTGERDNTED